MKKITLLALGRLKEPYLRDAAAEYEKRLSPFCRLSCIELSPARLPEHPSEAQIAAALEAEADAIFARLPARAQTVALCIEGRTVDSEEFSCLVTDGEESHTVFLLGSSHGLAERVKRAANVRLSLSPMTFPHQLARILLLEQIYRGFQIGAGSAYHK